jgi:hypothetical protein
MTANPVGCVLCLKEIGWCMCDRKTCQLPHRQPGIHTMDGYQLCTQHLTVAQHLNPDELRALVHRTNTPRKAT